MVEAFVTFVNELNSSAQKKGPCLLSYTLPELNGYSIELSRIDDRKIFAILRNKKDQQMAQEEVGVGVCVVGGEIYDSKIYIGDSEKIVAATVDGKGNVETTTHFEGLKTNLGYDTTNIKWAAKNFYTNWIEDLSKKETLYQTIRTDGKRIVSPDYTNPASITITGATSMDVTYSGGKNSWGKEDGGLVYVPGEGKVCVVGTFGGLFSNYDENGIDNDVFLDEDDDRYIKNKIRDCSVN